MTQQNKPIEHRFTKLSEIAGAVNEGNIKCLLADFGSWLQTALAVRNLEKLFPGQVSSDVGTEFRWLDDGKSEVHLSLTIKPSVGGSEQAK